MRQETLLSERFRARFALMVNEVVLIGSDMLGSRDEKLGRLLMSSFLRLLGQREELPLYIILWNQGVELADKGAETLEFLQALESRGVKIICCRTCVEYFGLQKRIGVGQIDGMVGIQSVLADHRVLTV
jgi:selenium metabolism protein YedF